MDLGFFILAALVVLILIGTVWRLHKLEQHLRTYNDYAEQVKTEAAESILSEEFLNQLRNHAQLQLTNTLQAMDKQFRQRLQQSQQALTQNIEQQAAQIINGELEQYRQTMSEARNAAANISKEIEKQLVDTRESVSQKAQAAVHEEKQQLLQKIDDKLSDIIVHYLVEALGEHVDLGSQKEYILSQLEAHKEDIKQDINDEF